MITMTEVVRYVQKRLGFPRFNFLSAEEIRDDIVDDAIPIFTHHFPYKSYYIIHPQTDAVDANNLPGLFKIVPKDCPIEKIYDVGMIFSSADIAVGGYPRDLGRTVYGGAMAIGALLYNQLNINLMSMTQGQQLTCEFVQPNYVQCYPKSRFRAMQSRPLVIELMVYHHEDLHTIPTWYQNFFRQLCEYVCKRHVYDLYKDYDDETVAGHQVRTKIGDWSDMDSKIEEWENKAAENSAKDPNRIDFFCV